MAFLHDDYPVNNYTPPPRKAGRYIRLAGNLLVAGIVIQALMALALSGLILYGTYLVARLLSTM